MPPSILKPTKPIQLHTKIHLFISIQIEIALVLPKVLLQLETLLRLSMLSMLGPRLHEGVRPFSVFRQGKSAEGDFVRLSFFQATVGTIILLYRFILLPLEFEDRMEFQTILPRFLATFLPLGHILGPFPFLIYFLLLLRMTN